MRVFYILYGDSHPSAIDIDIDKTYVDALQQAIKEKESALGPFETKHLMLYHIDATSTEDAIFKSQTLSSLKRLEVFWKLSDVFGPTGPAEQRIHILVKLPTGEQIQGSVVPSLRP